jgi:hypothetical protein
MHVRVKGHEKSGTCGVSPVVLILCTTAPPTGAQSVAPRTAIIYKIYTPRRLRPPPTALSSALLYGHIYIIYGYI